MSSVRKKIGLSKQVHPSVSNQLTTGTGDTPPWWSTQINQTDNQWDCTYRLGKDISPLEGYCISTQKHIHIQSAVPRHQTDKCHRSSCVICSRIRYTTQESPFHFQTIKVTTQSESHPPASIALPSNPLLFVGIRHHPGLTYCIEPTKGIMNSTTTTSDKISNRDLGPPPCLMLQPVQ